MVEHAAKEKEEIKYQILNKQTMESEGINFSTSHFDKLLKESVVEDRYNPFVENIDKLTAHHILYFVGQYCHFPANIISILTTACYTISYHGWEYTAKELRENINQELGYGDGKIDFGVLSNKIIPHYTILRRAILENTGRDIKDPEFKINAATDKFLKELNNIMAKDDPSYVAGASYALESSAINELIIVKKLMELLLEKIEPGKKPTRLMSDFFKYHIDDIEVMHRDELYRNAEQDIYIDYDDDTTLQKRQYDFHKGYSAVLTIMYTWWHELYQEAAAK